MFEPFDHEEFRRQTGLHAHENEAIYVRWVNTQINYANYLNMQQMSASLKEIVERLKDPAMVTMDGKYPFSR
jgi:hypothetical protein